MESSIEISDTEYREFNMNPFRKIRDFFHKVGAGFKRMGAETLPFTPVEKKYGIFGESGMYDRLRALLPDAVIKKSVCLDTETAKGEIDFLIVYQNKVFLVELKSWAGRVYQEGDRFYKEKESRGNQTYTKEMKSPFQQIRRNTYLIKQQFPDIWFEPAVVFQNSDSVNIEANTVPWFDKAEALADYIRNNGRQNRSLCIQYLLDHVATYDIMISSAWGLKEQACIVDASSLNFESDGRIIGKQEICEIRLTHYFSYDTVRLTLKNGTVVQAENENRVIRYKSNGKNGTVALGKIDYIEIG